MKLTKAIELLTHWQAGGEVTSFDDVNRAVKLGTEAMKHIHLIRQYDGDYRQMTLLGETPPE